MATGGDADSVLIRDQSTYEGFGDGDVAFVIAPAYTSGNDTAYVREFVERGGTLIVAYRESPRGDALLSEVGANARPDGALLRDEVNYHRSPRLPVATETGDNDLVANLSAVILNHGTVVDPNGATVLVESSPYSYLDRDGSGTPGDGQIDSFPVATVESVGDGQVIVVGDPSIFINAMQEQDENAAFTRALADGALADGAPADGTDHVIVDASGDTSVPPLIVLLLTVRQSPLLQVGLGLGALVVVGVAANVAIRIREQPRSP